MSSLATPEDQSRALDLVAPLLRCPVCGLALGARGTRAFGCASGHSFDVARQGYLAALTGRAGPPGDDAEMIAARDAFLSAGHFAPIAAALTAACAEAETVAEVGAGTGYYLAAAVAQHGRGIALDSARPALARAARCGPRVAAVAADIWRGLPLADSALDVVLCVFSPRNGPEFARVLRPGGSLLVVTPTPRHQAELVEPLGLIRVDPRKEERLRAALPAELTPAATETIEYPLALSHDEVAELVAMGPSSRHQDGATRAQRIAGLPQPCAVTVSVVVERFVRAAATAASADSPDGAA